MASFNSKSFEKKLKSLDASQTAIRTLALWIIHHRQFAKVIAESWLDQLKKAGKPEKRLVLFYLANDVVQNGRKKAKDLLQILVESFKEAMGLLCDDTIKTQVERVLTIWGERSIYDTDLVDKLRGRLDLAQKKKLKEKEIKEAAKEIANAQPETPQRKPVPPDFKVSKLLVAIKKSTSLENDMEHKHKKVEDLKIDVSSFDSVRHVKDRSSVGRFYKDFEESKVILEDYCHTLSKASTDKLILMDLLDGGDAFYEAAQEEARVIVNAYKTFGNRLNSMKRKLDTKIKKLEEIEYETSSYEPVVEPISDEDEVQEINSQTNSFEDEERNDDSHAMDPDLNFSISYNEDSMQSDADSQSQDSLEIMETQDMELDSASDEDSSLVFSQQYDPAAAVNLSSDYGNDTQLNTSVPKANGILPSSLEVDFMPQDTVVDLQMGTLQPQSSLPLLEQLSPRIPGLIYQETAPLIATSTDMKASIISGIQDNTALLGSLNNSLNDMIASATPFSLANPSEANMPTPSSMSAVLDNLFHGGLGKTVKSVINSEHQTLVTEDKPSRSGGSTPVQDEGAESESEQADLTPNVNAKERPLQNLIDSLFPMLSKSLQTIKEKQAEVEKEPEEKVEPDVTDAMMFALGENSEKDEVPRRKGKFVPFGSTKSPSPKPIVRSDISNSPLSSRIKARHDSQPKEVVQIPGLGIGEDHRNKAEIQISHQETLTPLQQLHQHRHQQLLQPLTSQDSLNLSVEQPQSFYGDQPITHLMEPVSQTLLPSQQQGILIQQGGLPVGHMPSGQMDPQLQQAQLPFGQLINASKEMNLISAIPPGFIIPSLPETVHQPVSSVQALDSLGQMTSHSQQLSFTPSGQHLSQTIALSVAEPLQQSLTSSLPPNLYKGEVENNEVELEDAVSNVSEGEGLDAGEGEWVERNIDEERGRDVKDRKEKDHEKESFHSSRKESAKSTNDRKGSDRKKHTDEKRSSDERKGSDHRKVSDDRKNSHPNDKKNSEEQKDSDEKDKKVPDEQRSSRRHRSRSPSDKKDGGSHRHSSSKHRSSNKDEDRKSKRSSSRSPSRRDSHRSSRDEKSTDRRKSTRQSSPHRRKSRGHRSSSKEKDRKRKHSPENTDPMYYNDRRSPTPEMDASSKKDVDLPPFQADVNQFQGEVTPFSGELRQFNQNVGQFNPPGQQMQILNPVLASNPQLPNVPVMSAQTLLPRGIQLMGMGGPRVLRPVTAEMIQHMKDQGQILPQPIGKISKDGTLIPNNPTFGLSDAGIIDPSAVSSEGENTTTTTVPTFSQNNNLPLTNNSAPACDIGVASGIATTFGTVGTETVTQILPNMQDNVNILPNAISGVGGALSAAPVDLQKLLSGNLSLISNLPLGGELRPRMPNLHIERAALDMLPQLPPLEINSNLQKLLLQQPQPNFNSQQSQAEQPQMIRFDSPPRPNGQLVADQVLRPRFDKPPPIFEPPPRFDVPPPRFDVPPPRFSVPPPRFDHPPPRFDHPPPRFDQSRPVLLERPPNAGPPGMLNGPVAQFPGNPRPSFNQPNSQKVFDLPDRVPHRAEPDPLLDALEKANDSRREDLSIAELQAKERKRSLSFESDAEKANNCNDTKVEDVRQALESPSKTESSENCNTNLDAKKAEENIVNESESSEQGNDMTSDSDIRLHPPADVQPPEYQRAPQNDFRPRFEGTFDNRPPYDGPHFDGPPPFNGPPPFDVRLRFDSRPRFRGRARFEIRPRFPENIKPQVDRYTLP